MKQPNLTSKSNLGRAVKKGVLWNLSGRGLLKVSDLIFAIVLARLLEPEHFGTFGIAMIFIGLASRVSNVGFVLALVQRKDIRDCLAIYVRNVDSLSAWLRGRSWNVFWIHARFIDRSKSSWLRNRSLACETRWWYRS